MSEPDAHRERRSLVVATVWGGAALAAIGFGGLLVAPSLEPLWIGLIVLAVAALPQSLVAGRRRSQGRPRG